VNRPKKNSPIEIPAMRDFSLLSLLLEEEDDDDDAYALAAHPCMFPSPRRSLSLDTAEKVSDVIMAAVVGLIEGVLDGSNEE